MALSSLLYSLESLPISPQKVSDAALSLIYKSTAKKTRKHFPLLKNPVETPVAAEEMFDFIDAERQFEPPIITNLLRLISHVSLANKVGRLEDAVVRARKGWAPYDTFNMGDYSARVIGEQLIYMAEHTQGWPGNAGFPEFEDWTTALRFHGETLVNRAANSKEHDALLDEWASIDGKISPEVRARKDALFKELQDVEAADHAATKESLKWVAEHYESLWM